MEAVGFMYSGMMASWVQGRIRDVFKGGKEKIDRVWIEALINGE